MRVGLLHAYLPKWWYVPANAQLIEYQGIILMGTLVFGFAPVGIVVVFCVFTGRIKALFSSESEESVETSPFIGMMIRLSLILLPVYFVLLCVYAYLNLTS